MRNSLEGKVILVTGAAGGIGLGICRAILEAGGRVSMGDLDQDALNEAKGSLVSSMALSDERLLVQPLDVSNQRSVQRAMNATVDSTGRLDGLVNNAGVIRLGENIHASIDDWREQFEINVIAVHLCCVEFADLIVRRGLSEEDMEASVVNIASNAGKVGYPNMAGYNASKAAVINLTRTLSAEWAERNINVNAVCPGGVLTPMLHEVARSIANRIDEDAAELVKTMVPAQIGRHIDPVEVGRIVAFLLSDTATIIRGQSINVDGGDTPY